MAEDESAAKTARRECREEIGVELPSIELVGRVWMTPSTTTERVHLFLGDYRASDKVTKGGVAEGELENLDVREEARSDLWAALERGEITDATLHVASGAPAQTSRTDGDLRQDLPRQSIHPIPNGSVTSCLNGVRLDLTVDGTFVSLCSSNLPQSPAMIVLRPLCLLGIHIPDVPKTRHVGTDYVSECRGCGKRLIKKRMSKRWVVMRTSAKRRK